MVDVEAARETLLKFLTDMAALKDFADVGNPDADDFVAAFSAARERAKRAAREYVAALGREPRV